MIKQLRKIYSSLIVHKNGFDHLTHDYKWFITDDNEIIGINKDELTSKDASLLAAFLLPYNIKVPILTDKEQMWKKMITTNESDQNIKIENAYRFVYFSIKENEIDPLSFNDAIQELFDKQVPILWNNGYEGVIIEEQTILEDRIIYEQIIDVLMSDLYVNISFFVGPFQENVINIQHLYQSLVNAAQTIFTYSNKTVVTYIDAVPYLLINQTEHELRNDISETILQEYINDEETLKMIETFVQCNLNISETSKELYMHRNSLQYRLDRFFEKTGLDVRKFHHAMAVYLALLAKKSDTQ